MPRSAHAPLTAIVLSVLALLTMPAGALAFGPLSSFGSRGQAAGQFEQAEGLAIAPDGTTYVGNFNGNRIDVFSAQGTFLFAFGKAVDPHGGDTCTTASGCKDGAGSGSAGEINTPSGVAIGPEGNLFVLDEGNHRIDVFTTAGQFLRAFGKEVNVDLRAANPDLCTVASGCQAGPASAQAGGLREPSGLDFDGAGNLFVADFGTNRIDVFNAAGDFLSAFGKEVNAEPVPASPDLCTAASGCKAGIASGSAGSVGEPLAVNVAPNGEIAVGDLQGERIDVFTAGGQLLRAFGKEVNAEPVPANSDLCTAASGCKTGAEGSVAGAFETPGAIAINGADELYVADRGLNRIDRYTIDGRFTGAFGTGVIDGSGAFQSCTSFCQTGSRSQAPESISFPTAIALDCRGALYTNSEGAGFAHIERFGEPGTPPAPCTPAAAPSNGFKIGKLKLNKKKGTATLLVEVPGAGTLALSGKGLRKVTGSSGGADKIQLPVKPVGKAKRKLNKAGVVKLKALLTFTPTGGTAATQSKKLTLKKTLRRKRGRR